MRSLTIKKCEQVILPVVEQAFIDKPAYTFPKLMQNVEILRDYVTKFNTTGTYMGFHTELKTDFTLMNDCAFRYQLLKSLSLAREEEKKCLQVWLDDIAKNISICISRLHTLADFATSSTCLTLKFAIHMNLRQAGTLVPQCITALHELSALPVRELVKCDRWTFISALSETEPFEGMKAGMCEGLLRFCATKDGKDSKFGFFIGFLLGFLIL